MTNTKLELANTKLELKKLKEFQQQLQKFEHEVNILRAKLDSSNQKLEDMEIFAIELLHESKKEKAHFRARLQRVTDNLMTERSNNKKEKHQFITRNFALQKELTISLNLKTNRKHEHEINSLNKTIDTMKVDHQADIQELDIFCDKLEAKLKKAKCKLHAILND